VAQFDTWAGNFGESVTALELSPDGGGYRMNTRFARFVNLPELMTMFREVADIRTADMLKLPVPRFHLETVTAKPTAALKAFVATLVERAEAIRNGTVSPNEDNMLAVTNDGRKAALDMRLVDPREPEAQDGKVSLCAERIHGIWRDTDGVPRHSGRVLRSEYADGRWTVQCLSRHTGEARGDGGSGNGNRLHS
jgi:hypothetical protein